MKMLLTLNFVGYYDNAGIQKDRSRNVGLAGGGFNTTINTTHIELFTM